MSRFLKEFDAENNLLSITLVIESLNNFDDQVAVLNSEKTRKFIDISLLLYEDVFTIINDFASNQSDIIFLLDEAQVSEYLVENTRKLKSIDFKNNHFYFVFGEDNEGIIEDYKSIALNLQYKNKSFELEIVESLLTEQDSNNEVINQLQKELQYSKTVSGKRNDDELEVKYLDLMEKYKQSLKRLEQLRSSKLGKLQVAYWDRKRGY